MPTGNAGNCPLAFKDLGCGTDAGLEGGTLPANQAAILFGLVIGSLTEPSGGRIKTHLSNLKGSIRG